MKIKKLVIGSKNRAKLDEWREFLGEFVEVVELNEVGPGSGLSGMTDVEESGKTFLENAKIKASYYARLTHEYVFAEDGGFEVEVLGGKPGVKSRRILPGDKEATDEQLVQFILDSLKKSSNRVAKLTVAVAISDLEGNIIYTDQNSLEGIVPETVEKVSIRGYPYRDLLHIPEFGKLYSKLSSDEHEKVNHKRKLARRIGEFLKNA